jgi:hypothetical protein
VKQFRVQALACSFKTAAWRLNSEPPSFQTVLLLGAITRLTSLLTMLNLSSSPPLNIPDAVGSATFSNPSSAYTPSVSRKQTRKGVCVSEHTILWIAGIILGTLTAIRIILFDLTHVVVLYKKLKATIKSELPPGPDSG